MNNALIGVISYNGRTPFWGFSLELPLKGVASNFAYLSPPGVAPALVLIMSTIIIVLSLNISLLS